MGIKENSFSLLRELVQRSSFALFGFTPTASLQACGTGSPSICNVVRTSLTLVTESRCWMDGRWAYLLYVVSPYSSSRWQLSLEGVFLL